MPIKSKDKATQIHEPLEFKFGQIKKVSVSEKDKAVATIAVISRINKSFLSLVIYTS